MWKLCRNAIVFKIVFEILDKNIDLEEFNFDS